MCAQQTFRYMQSFPWMECISLFGQYSCYCYCYYMKKLIEMAYWPLWAKQSEQLWVRKAASYLWTWYGVTPSTSLCKCVEEKLLVAGEDHNRRRSWNPICVFLDTTTKPGCNRLCKQVGNAFSLSPHLFSSVILRCGERKGQSRQSWCGILKCFMVSNFNTLFFCWVTTFIISEGYVTVGCSWRRKKKKEKK